MTSKKKARKAADAKKKAAEEARAEETRDQAPILAIFVEARTEAKKTIPQLSRALKIHTRYLKALEEGNTDALPETVYTLGFVRSVANYLNLDPNQCVKDYKEQVLYTREPQKNVVIPKPPKESMAPRRALLFASFMLVIGGYMAWLYITEKDTDLSQDALEVAENDALDEGETLFEINEPEVEDPFAFEDQPVSKEAAEKLKKKALQIEASLKPKEKEGSESGASSLPLQGEASNLDHSTADIIVMANQRSWIEIKDKDKKILYRGILKKGELYPVPKGDGMVFTTGNAGGISFSYKGKKTPVMGRPGQVIRRIPLTKETLAKIGRPAAGPSSSPVQPAQPTQAEATPARQQDPDDIYEDGVYP